MVYKSNIYLNLKPCKIQKNKIYIYEEEKIMESEETKDE